VLEDISAAEVLTDVRRGAGLRIENSAQVEVLGCNLVGSTWSGFTGANPGIEVTASAVNIVGSIVFGGDGGTVFAFGSAPGAPAARFVDSTINLVRSSAFGGDGGTTIATHGGLLGTSQGLPGIQAENSARLLAGDTVIKIVAGQTVCYTPSPCGINGGPAVLLLQGSVVVTTTNVDFVPGPPPCPPQPGCTLNLPGPDFQGDGTESFTTTATIFPSLTGPAAGLPLGGAGALSIHGEPNTPVTVYWSPSLVAPVSLPFVGGLAVLDSASLNTLGSLQLDASGSGSMPVAVPTSPPLLGLTAHMQVLQIGSYLGLSSPWPIYVK
jgi:hypothetical protein